MSSIHPITTTASIGAMPSLRAKLNGGVPEPLAAAQPGDADSYKLLKGRIHLKLLEKFDLGALETQFGCSISDTVFCNGFEAE